MKPLYLVFAISFLLMACSKSEEASPPVGGDNTTPATNRELITAKAWRYVGWTANPPVKDADGKLISDILNNKPACDQDDLLIFKASGNVDFDQGATKCDQSTPQSSLSSWGFKDNETKLDMANRVYNIKALTDSELKIEFEDIVGSTIHIHTVTFNH